jgi:hypothetical protein
MLAVIVAAVGGAIGALAAVALAVPPLGAVLAAAAAFLLVLALMRMWGQQAVTQVASSLEPRFPSPGTQGTASPGRRGQE